MLHPEYHTCDKCGKIIKRTLENGVANSYTLSINVPNGSSLPDIERIGEEYVQNNELGDAASDVRVQYRVILYHKQNNYELCRRCAIQLNDIVEKYIKE